MGGTAEEVAAMLGEAGGDGVGIAKGANGVELGGGEAGGAEQACRIRIGTHGTANDGLEGQCRVAAGACVPE